MQGCEDSAMEPHTSGFTIRALAGGSKLSGNANDGRRGLSRSPGIGSPTEGAFDLLRRFMEMML